MSKAKMQLTTCPKKTAVAYARYSSAQQRDVSIDQQLKDIRAYAEREGYTIIYEYADRAKSGFKHVENRTEFQEMLRAAESGAFNTVIAWKVDRFGRDRRESAIYKGQLSDCGVSVVYAMEPIPDGAAGCLTEGMLEAIAEWYSRNLSENVKRGMNDNAQKALYNGVSIYGYRRGENNKYAIDEAEAAVVRKIFTLYSQNYSCESIKRILDADGVKSRNGIPMPKPSIIYMIKNETYNGVYHFGSCRITDAFPKIIDDDLWNTCQELRERTTRKHDYRVYDYLLSGKCTCGLCGNNIIGAYSHGWTPDVKYVYYTCKLHRSNKNLCALKAKYKLDVEDKVLSFLQNEVVSGEFLDHFLKDIEVILDHQKETTPVFSLKKELKEVNRKIENINKAISEGIWSKQTASMLNDLNNRAEELQKQITYHSLTESTTLSKERIRFYYKKMASGDIKNPDYQRTLINSLINSIVFYDDYIQLVINTSEHSVTVPPGDLPPIKETPEYPFDSRLNSPASLFTVKSYNVIVFKIAV